MLIEKIISPDELAHFGSVDNLNEQAKSLVSQQKATWGTVGKNYEVLNKVQTKTFDFGHFKITAQFNSERFRSSAAKTDAKSISERPCFLCAENLPTEQKGILFQDNYLILVNPFPIFSAHLTISKVSQAPQEILPYFSDLLELSRSLNEFTVFYNGPKCGASAPDHVHFQAVIKNSLPIENEFNTLESQFSKILFQNEKTKIIDVENYLRRFIAIISDDKNEIEKRFHHIYKNLETGNGEEPMMNILCSFQEGKWRMIIFPRDKQRPSHFFKSDEKQITVSPAAVEMGGVLVLPGEDDFKKISGKEIEEIFGEVTLNQEAFDKLIIESHVGLSKIEINIKSQPKINVGILATEKLHFACTGSFQFNDTEISSGEYSAIFFNDRVIVTDDAGNQISSETILFIQNSYNSFFELKNVTIGVNFHWEQQENQQFQGSLKLIPENGKVRAINIIDLEEYLKSVISSEMSATSSSDLLKAHAVISRSWLLAQIEKTKSIKNSGGLYQTSLETENKIIRWYDREDHNNFDVCADDHCQRYQGISKIHSEKALKAVEETFGEVLVFGDKICDTRFSKCCGGISENFENVWEPVSHPYLTKVVDSEFGDTTCVDLRQEEEAELWIRNKPHAFCNTTDQQILSQVLPNFDQQTTDFYRWKVEYSQNEISDLIKSKSGIDFGEIVKLESVKRGHSARIIKLKITGTKKTLTVGKELEIRKWLSNSHLYSSAFVIDQLEMVNGIPQKIVLTGAGWGHGVGLCQIGAAVMGEKGYSYKAILNHYFRGAELKKLYQMKLGKI